MVKYKKLFLSIVLDAIGLVSFIIPLYGDFTDVIWAPLSAYIMTRLYKSNAGKIGAVVSLVEEIAPFLDVVPTFTIMWFYETFFEHKKKPQ